MILVLQPQSVLDGGQLLWGTMIQITEYVLMLQPTRKYAEFFVVVIVQLRTRRDLFFGT
jgi:hypothetical protein